MVAQGLVCLQDRALAAVVLIVAHFGAWSFADDILLREIAGGKPAADKLYRCGIPCNALVMKSACQAARVAILAGRKR